MWFRSSRLLTILLSPSLIAGAALDDGKRAVGIPIADKSATKKPVEEDDAPKETKFNGLTVPPMTELGPNVRKQIQNDYWYAMSVLRLGI